MALLEEISEMFRADADEVDDTHDFDYQKALLGARRVQYLGNCFLVAFAAGNSKNQELLLSELSFFIEQAQEDDAFRAELAAKVRLLPPPPPPPLPLPFPPHFHRPYYP
jgi:hypothetical protein